MNGTIDEFNGHCRNCPIWGQEGGGLNDQKISILKMSFWKLRIDSRNALLTIVNCIDSTVFKIFNSNELRLSHRGFFERN